MHLLCENYIGCTFVTCAYMQWLESLPSDQARQEVFEQVMKFFADGTIQPPHASKLAAYKAPAIAIN